MGGVKQLLQYITKSRFVRSIFFQIISVFMIVIVLLVAILSYSFRSQITNGIISEQKTRLDAAEEAISSRMEEVTSIAYNIGQDSMFFINPVLGAKYSGYEMSNTLSRYLVGNRFIKYLAYYRLSQPESIYTSCGELSFHRFWDSYLECDSHTEESYLELIKSNKGVNLIPLSASGKGITFFTYVCPLPQFSTKPQAFVIALIPLEEISSLLSSQLASGEGETALFDAGGNLIYQVSTLVTDIPCEPSPERASYSRSIMTVDWSKYSRQEKISEVNGWTYISLVRLNSVMSGLDGAQFIVILALVVLMIAAVCIILTGIISKYKPISNLALTLTDRSEHESPGGIIDEKTLLSSTIATLKSDSEQKQKLEVAYQEATEASRAKSAFLSNMSHDIRTPMNAIIGMTGIALKHVSDPEYVKDCLQKVEVASHYLLDIINNVLDMSRIESGKITLTRDVIDLDDFIRNIVMIIQTNIDQKHQRLIVDAQNIRDKRVIGDSVRLSQICMNILSNSVKFTPDGGEITMRVIQDEPCESGFGDYVFLFSDTGIGMSNDFVEKVFDTFSRAKESKMSKVEGTGLGMAIAKNLVELMGGSIECESEPGQGTTFTVKLHMEIASGEPACERSAAADARVGVIDLSGKRVLLVEDNIINREIARKLISETNAEVSEAADGKEALDVFKGHPAGYFDAILMDVQMPVMDGIEAAKAIRSLNRPDAAKISIYAMTANTFDEDVRDVLNAGMNGHLGKPYSPEQLYAVLEKAILGDK